jgi:hypothetical protein
MNAFLYNIGHLLDTVKLATINLKLKENTATYQSYNNKSSDFMDTTVFQENHHISFFHWISISHPGTPIWFLHPHTPPTRWSPVLFQALQYFKRWKVQFQNNFG